MAEKTSRPPLSVQILSLVATLCFGLYCIVKGISFGFFNWWYIVGGSCLVAAAFASFRVYEVCVNEVRSEATPAVTSGNP